MQSTCWVTKVKATSLAELSGGGFSGNVEVSKLAGGSYEDTMNATSTAPDKKQEKASSGNTMEEVAKHTKKGDVWVVLHGHVVIGTLGDGGEDDDDEGDDSSEGGYTMEEVAKHNKKGDVWVVLNGRVLNVSKFLSQHPDGELAILTFAGKDAPAEFDMIHLPDVVDKYAPDAIIGVGNGKGQGSREVGLACCHR